MGSDLQHSAARLIHWLTRTVLPVWAARARFPDGSWAEHLNLDGTPDWQAERRWRVMARQAVSYADATRLGWYDGRDVAVDSFATYWDQGVKNGAVIHRVLPDGTISDASHDLYDHAFGLLACARLFQVTGDQAYLRKADVIRDWITSQASPHGGWEEGTLKPLPRRQNPHMHLLEASLAMFEATGLDRDLEIARTVMGLFERHFFVAGRVREFFTEDWQPDPMGGEVAEPGHAVEWVWLLGQYGRATGVDVRDAQSALYETAILQRGPRLYDEETLSGEIVRQSTRLWVQTETVKAHLTMAERGAPGAADMAAALIDGMFTDSLLANGLWADQLNACGANIAKTVPTSTLYHIVGMAAEAQRISRL